MSVIHRVDVRDGSLLDIVSGLESTARRFDGLLEQYVPGKAEAGAADDPRTVDLLLGLVAVRERLRAVLLHANASGAVRDSAPMLRPFEESWLR